jgi:hypothetical protein
VQFVIYTVAHNCLSLIIHSDETVKLIMSRKHINTNVSVSTLTRNDKIFIRHLAIEKSLGTDHGNSKAICWNYFGKLKYDRSDNEVGEVEDDDVYLNKNRIYCSLCLDDVKKNLNKTNPNAAGLSHISKVKNFSNQTSTGNLNVHLKSAHNIETMNEGKVNSIVNYFRSYSGQRSQRQDAPTSHELNRDLALWLCRDLLPFALVSNEGFNDFCGKYLPDVTLPSEATLLGTALNDIYTAGHQVIKGLVCDVNSLCVMFDSWTDKYKARPYFAVRVSFVKDWKFYIVTLSCQVVLHHTGEALSDHVMKVLGQYVAEPKKLFLTTCHDGAANVVKASRLLKSEHFQHCLGHALHLLLVTDGIHSIEDLTVLLQKCRDIVTSLHFKGALIENEIDGVNDKKLIDSFVRVVELIDLEQQFPLDDVDDPEAQPQPAHESSSGVRVTHRHETLKQYVCTRWNSYLNMIQSILDLKHEVQNALKKSGNAHLCLYENEISLLEELSQFLQPFQELTELVSGAGAVLSLQPLMKVKIKKLCSENRTDDQTIKDLKKQVLRNIEKRLPESDTVKIFQILDHETRTCYSAQEAVRLLMSAATRVQAKGIALAASLSSPPLESSTHSGADSPTTKRRKKKQELLNEIRAEAAESAADNGGTSTTADASLRDQLEREVSTYFAIMPAASFQDDALSFWKEHCQILPLLSRLAKIYLGISAASVPVECLFSTAGIIMNGKRSSLKPDKLDKIVFLHNNFKYIIEELS